MAIFNVLLAVVLPVCEVAELADDGARKYPGRVVPVAQVDIVPQVSGEILEVAFANGQIVRKGDLLYRLDPVKYEAAVKNAEAKTVELKANLAYAELSAKRHKTLVASRAVSQDALDNAVSQRDAARASLAAAEADLVAARDDLRHCRILAPISGRIGTTAYTEGNYVQKGAGKLVTLIQTAPIRVCFPMANGDYQDRFASRADRLVKEGIVALRLMSGRECVATGSVEYVENASDALTDTTEVYALFPNGDGLLKSGQTVMVTLLTANGVLRPAVPPNAVVQDMKGAFVWLLDGEDRAEKRYIERGRLAGRMQFVLSGLAKGDRIVADGTHKVRAGATVEAEAPAADGEGGR